MVIRTQRALSCKGCHPRWVDRELLEMLTPTLTNTTLHARRGVTPNSHPQCLFGTERIGRPKCPLPPFAYLLALPVCVCSVSFTYIDSHQIISFDAAGRTVPATSVLEPDSRAVSYSVEVLNGPRSCQLQAARGTAPASEFNARSRRQCPPCSCRERPAS